MQAKQIAREQRPHGRDITAIMTEGSAIDAALKRAAREALLRHKQLGLSVPIWRNGHTKWISPEEIDALLAHDDGGDSSRRGGAGAPAEA